MARRVFFEKLRLAFASAGFAQVGALLLFPVICGGLASCGPRPAAPSATESSAPSAAPAQVNGSVTSSSALKEMAAAAQEPARAPTPAAPPRGAEDINPLPSPAPRALFSEEDEPARETAPASASSPSEAIEAAATPAMTVASACAEYLHTASADERSQLLPALDALSPAERVQAIATLFPQEKNSNLLVQMLELLGGIEGQDAATLPIITAAARRDRPEAVRAAAAAALESNELPAARETWRIFLADPDPALREQAAAALERTAPPPALPPGI